MLGQFPTVTRRNSLVLLACVLSACAGANEADDQVSAFESPIHDGTDSTNLASGVLNLANVCSATIYSDYWVLTAAHCIANLDSDNDGQITTAESAGNYWVTPGPNANNQAATLTPTRIFKHPTAKWGTTAGPDVAMLWLGGGDGFHTEFLSTYNYTNSAGLKLNLYQGNNNSLLNNSVWAFGYGPDDNGHGFGTLRSGWKTVLQAYSGGYSGSGQTANSGDSGGPDYFWSGSKWTVTGVHSSGYTGGGMDWQFGAEAWRNWVTATGNHCPAQTARGVCSLASWHQLRNKAKSSLRLAVKGGPMSSGGSVYLNDGTSVIVWDAYSGDQTWNMPSAAGSGQISNSYPNKSGKQLCLGVQGASRTEGASLIVWPCGGQPDQQWQLLAASSLGKGSGYQGCFVLWNTTNSMAAGVAGGGTPTAGKKVIQWRYDGTDNQFWCET